MFLQSRPASLSVRAKYIATISGHTFVANVSRFHKELNQQVVGFKQLPQCSHLDILRWKENSVDPRRPWYGKWPQPYTWEFKMTLEAWSLLSQKRLPMYLLRSITNWFSMTMFLVRGCPMAKPTRLRKHPPISTKWGPITIFSEKLFALIPKVKKILYKPY